MSHDTHPWRLLTVGRDNAVGRRPIRIVRAETRASSIEARAGVANEVRLGRNGERRGRTWRID